MTAGPRTLLEDRLPDESVPFLSAAARFAFQGARRFLEAQGAGAPELDPALVEGADLDFLLDAAAGDLGPQTEATRALAYFGRFYCLHDAALSEVARAASPDLAAPALARIGSSLVAAAEDPALATPHELADLAVRASAVASALARWMRRDQAAREFEASHRPALAEAQMKALADPASPAFLGAAARVEEAVQVLEARLGASPVEPAGPEREAVEEARRTAVRVPAHITVRAAVAEAVSLALGLEFRQARERLEETGPLAPPAEREAGARRFLALAAGRIEGVEDGNLERLLADLAELARRQAEQPVRTPAKEEPPGGAFFAPGTHHRAVVERIEGTDVVVSLAAPDGGIVAGRIPDSGWHWPEGGPRAQAAVRKGDSVVVGIEQPPDGEREATLATVDPWAAFLPRFFRANQERIFSGRVCEVEDERLVLSVIDRLIGEPDGVQGELPADAMDLGVPLPLPLFFRRLDEIPVLVDQIDAEKGWLLFSSPWIDRDPWQEGYVAKRYRPGDIRRGTVVSVEPDWVGVLVEPGIIARMPPPRGPGRYGLGVPVEVVVKAVDAPLRVLAVERKLRTAVP